MKMKTITKPKRKYSEKRKAKILEEAKSVHTGDQYGNKPKTLNQRLNEISDRLAFSEAQNETLQKNVAQYTTERDEALKTKDFYRFVAIMSGVLNVILLVIIFIF